MQTDNKHMKKKVFSISSHDGNENKNYTEIFISAQLTSLPSKSTKQKVCCQEFKRKGNLGIAEGALHMYNSCDNQGGPSSEILKFEVPFDPDIILLDVFP